MSPDDLTQNLMKKGIIFLNYYIFLFIQKLIKKVCSEILVKNTLYSLSIICSKHG